MKGLYKALIYIGGIIVGFMSIVAGEAIYDAILPQIYDVSHLLQAIIIIKYIIYFLLVDLFWFDLPKRYCAMLDVKEFEKEARKRGMTPGEYAASYFAPSLLDLCESCKNDHKSLNELLKRAVDGEAITKSDANVLWYMVRKWK